MKSCNERGYICNPNIKSEHWTRKIRKIFGGGAGSQEATKKREDHCLKIPTQDKKHFPSAEPTKVFLGGGVQIESKKLTHLGKKLKVLEPAFSNW